MKIKIFYFGLLLFIFFIFLPYHELLSGSIVGEFKYNGCKYTIGGPYACEATYYYEGKSDTILLRKGELKDLLSKEKALLIDELRYVYLEDGTKLTLYYEIERDIYYGRILVERAEYDFPQPGNYETMYDYNKLTKTPLPSETPYSSITRNGKTGEIVARTRVLDFVIQGVNKGYLLLEEVHYSKGKVIFKSNVRRDRMTGRVIDEKPIMGERQTDFHTWWPGPAFGWPVRSGF